jgi:hypothetical protein
VAPAPPPANWVGDVREALAGFRRLAVGQLVPSDSGYELVLTSLHSPPEAELVEAVQGAIGPLVGRDDSPVAALGDSAGGAAWHWYPALDEATRALFARLDWRNAILVHERLD